MVSFSTKMLNSLKKKEKSLPTDALVVSMQLPKKDIFQLGEEAHYC